MKPDAALVLRVPPRIIDRLIPLFGAGVGIKTVADVRLMALLCDQLGIDSDYVDRRVQTIFVNGRAVDYTEQVEIPADAVIALSAAMPGLAGATFRKGGLFAGFRKDISHNASTARNSAHQETMVTLKLFNLVAKEIGAHLLSKGVWVKGKTLETHLNLIDPPLFAEMGEVLWDGRSIPAGHLRDIHWTDDWLRLEVHPSDDEPIR